MATVVLLSWLLHGIIVMVTMAIVLLTWLLTYFVTMVTMVAMVTIVTIVTIMVTKVILVTVPGGAMCSSLQMKSLSKGCLGWAASCCSTATLC